MKTEFEDAINRLRANLSRWRVPAQLVEELVDPRGAVKYPRGATIFHEGALGDLFGCVLSGYAKVYCNQSDGSRVLVRVAGPGDLIGHWDYEDSNGRRSKIFEIQAHTSCSIALFTREHVIRLLRSIRPERLIELFQSLNTFWSAELHWWVSLSGLPFEQRLEVVLADLGRRMGIHNGDETVIVPELSQADLAEMIASSRPLVSRLLAEMDRRGWVRRRGKQFVLLKNWHSDGRGYAHVPGAIGEELRSITPGLRRRNRAAVIEEIPKAAEEVGVLRSIARN
ncbi:MAG TPA: Crp/Fnr family transcriptional regulator [Candidatus Binataceae bacterium]|nr:Crp/Fnr family transcriptional regulator [Candidatus Binataceae bacterium]